MALLQTGADTTSLQQTSKYQSGLMTTATNFYLYTAACFHSYAAPCVRDSGDTRQHTDAGHRHGLTHSLIRRQY